MVVSQADGPSSVGTTTHIPWHKLSTRYVIVSTNPVKYFSQFALASIDENTMVWITFQMKEGLQIDGKVYHSGDIFSLRLNRFETYQIAHTVDMTGTVVESSSSIAVFSGNDCNILNGQGFWITCVNNYHRHQDLIQHMSFLLICTAVLIYVSHLLRNQIYRSIVQKNSRGSHINVWSTLILLFQATNHVILNQMNRYW